MAENSFDMNFQQNQNTVLETYMYNKKRSECTENFGNYF